MLKRAGPISSLKRLYVFISTPPNLPPRLQLQPMSATVPSSNFPFVHHGHDQLNIRIGRHAVPRCGNSLPSQVL
ncbi:uncharacterized [Tachysurus ichikawai]